MRVTMLSKALVNGAYQRKCELIAAHNDIELTVFAPPRWGETPLERAHTNGYTLREIPIRFNGNFHLHHYPTLSHELRLSRPDIFHVDEEPYNLATWLALHANHPRVHSSKRLFFSWQNIYRIYPPPFNWIERDVLRTCDAAIAGNREAESVWRAKGFVRDIFVIPQFGVDEEAFRPSSSFVARHSSSFVIGFVGRLVKEKGVDLLIRSLAQLPAQVRLIAVGSGDQESNLRKLAANLNLVERVEFRGTIPNSQIANVYSEFDALVLPSRTAPNWKEQFGRALIEAMSRGTPVIGANSGEIPNVVGDAGLLFKENDVDDLSNRLLLLFSSSRLREELSRKGRERVLEKFTMKRIADATVEAYWNLSRSVK